MTRKFQQNGRWAIFAMKIEVTCPSCKSLLRVDASHAGKQVRCPSCGSLSTIPSPENSEPILGENRPGPTRSDVLGSEDQPTTAPIHQAEHYPNYRIGPEDQPPAGVWQHSGNQQSLPTDGRDTTAMILGGLAIGSLFVCGCLTPALAGTGFFIARSSKGPSRSIAIVTNVIALVLWLLSVVFWIIVVLVM